MNFQVGLQGSIIVSQLLAGKQHIGYMGDMPAIVGASKRQIARPAHRRHARRRRSDQCDVFLVRNDAPEFADAEGSDQVDGRQDRRHAAGQLHRPHRAGDVQAGGRQARGVPEPALDVITSNFQSGKIDAAMVWEPTASRLVNAGPRQAGRPAAPASTQTDAGFLVMSQELLKDRPDVAEAWLKAELDAQRYLADPANADEIAAIAKEQTQGFEEQDLWDALYKKWARDKGGSEDGVRIRLPFLVTDDAQAHIAESASFLADIKAIAGDLPADVVDDSVAEKVLGSQDPPGEIKAHQAR